MTQAMETSTRAARAALEIAAPVEAVWKALTEPSEIVRWFALESEVAPGAGGAMTWRWAEAYRWDTRIEIWEPLRRLKLSYTQKQVDDHLELGGTGKVGDSYELVVDFEIESVTGGTWLRCVHSGFGRDAVWDNELEGVRKGWLAELESLRHYLERHHGSDRRAWWAFLQRDFPAVDAWRALVPHGEGRGGVVRMAADGTLRVAVRELDTTLIPVRLDPPGDLVARVPAWNDAMLRIWCDPHGENGSMINLFLSFYGSAVDAERAESKQALLAALQEALDARNASITVLET